MTKITTVRHGETSWNALRKMQGQVDIELNEVGLEQARKIANRFKDEPIDIIFTTTLKRAIQTAEAINEYHHVPLIQVDGLKEMSFGEVEGLPWEEVKDAIMAHRTGGPKLADVEEMSDFFDRVHREMDIITQSEHKNIVIVGHFGTIRSIVCYFNKLDYTHAEKFIVSNTAVHVFEKEDGEGDFKMTMENDNTHLG